MRTNIRDQFKYMYWFTLNLSIKLELSHLYVLRHIRSVKLYSRTAYYAAIHSH